MSLRSPSEKKRAISYCFWLSFLRTEDLYSSYLSYKLDRIYPPPPQAIAAARSFICSDHVRAEQEHRLDGVLLEQGPQVLQKQPHCGEEPLDAGLRRWKRSE